ncbi:MAG TPA: tetratricopeptide repeat protein [Bryobacteraceae bacterium]|nr:tetratricopeptide repeat protein [Bryobacteraceae bacterium]
MRLVILAAALALAPCGLRAQAADAAYAPLSRAYAAVQSRDYDTAIAAFLQAVGAAPRRAAIRKDLAYTYLKVGENVLAREQFREAMEIDPADTQVALEFAFLAYETNQRQQARRIFDRVRKSGQAPYAATAEQAFQNVDRPLAEGIDRWSKAIALGADDFSVHDELAKLAEERDEFELAAKHYEAAWRLDPRRRYVLVDLARVWQALGRSEDAMAALLAASRGGGQRAAEAARELLPSRYPFVSEFERALELDPTNAELRRDLGFLLLKLGREEEAEPVFQYLARTAPDDLLSATQLGFLLYARGDLADAQPLFDRVLAGKDADLANRVRAVLRRQQVAADPKPAAPDAKEMAERSIKAGYMKDAVKYLLQANEADPADYSVMLRLGWAYNLLRQDADAIEWFAKARASSDAHISAEARQAYENLRGEAAPFHLTAWAFPMYSTRWSDAFGYAQAKGEFATRLPLRVYASLRFIGDTRGQIGAVFPTYLSESAMIPAIGVRSVSWHRAMAWAEAGISVGYLTRHAVPDYRAGVSYARAVGRPLSAESRGWFAESNLDAVFVSRFGNDTLVYAQARSGYVAGPKNERLQAYWNSDMTFDLKRQSWANFLETGPGVKLAGGPLPKGAYFTFNALRGRYTVGGAPGFTDLRVGVWYAVTR